MITKSNPPTIPEIAPKRFQSTNICTPTNYIKQGNLLISKMHNQNRIKKKRSPDEESGQGDNERLASKNTG